MASTSQNGHDNNIANFDQMISYVTAYGVTYNPSKTTLKLPALQALSTTVKNAVNTLNITLQPYSKAVAVREASFEPLSSLTTRIINAFKATDATPQVIDNAKTYIRKIQGKRATPKLTDEEKKALSVEGKEVKEISSSQMGYDNRLSHFDQLIKLLSTESTYAPNEVDLKITSLTTMLNDLRVKNSAVVSTITIVSNARISRNEVMYKAKTNLYNVSLDVKTYVKSVYGATSPQYKQMSSLKFTNLR
jgi:hypothetical protein